MKYKKTIILLGFAVFLLSITCVSASEIDNTITSDDINSIELSADNEVDTDNLEIGEEKTTLSQADNDESMGEGNDSQVVGARTGSYSGLSSEIGSGGIITLKHDYYRHDSGSTIQITVDNSVIDGKGAVIDMAGSTNMRAFYVSTSSATFKSNHKKCKK